MNAPELVALVRAGAKFVNGKLVDRSEGGRRVSKNSAPDCLRQHADGGQQFLQSSQGAALVGLVEGMWQVGATAMDGDASRVHSGGGVGLWSAGANGTAEVWHAMKRRLRACPPSKPPGAGCRVTNPGENSPRQGLPCRPAFADQVSIRPSSRSEQWKCGKSDGPSTPSCVVPSALKR